ncbi:acyl-homoserine-lactone synthase [Oceaniglobus indicus]|uniref:acyl-homoserine-lactone synthase n=1 Tax=Oceaniglobus indicus TaxID=2047749 RepID=UPI000C197528|nr:acyl-homoserine-lactone synthase [Oceaniglobus indicus]
MHGTTLSIANMHQHGELFANMLRARHELFIQHNHWDLPEDSGMEYDQYDTPASRWVVIHDADGQVLAGNRLTPTTTRCGIYTYMIRDAQRGLLDTIPANLLYEEAPVAADVWESSRVFVSHRVSAAKRGRVHAQLYLEVAKAAQELGISAMIGILNANWPRWAPRIGMDISGIGPIMEIDGERTQAISINFASRMN